jgi:hypothetical protein
MTAQPIYRRIASLLDARANCAKSGNTEWFAKHTEHIDDIMASAPSGSGIDNGTTLDYDASTPDKLVFHTAFHHMDDGGGYDGWTEHTITVRASLAFGIDVRISGRDRDGIKEYLGDTYHGWLTETA